MTLLNEPASFPTAMWVVARYLVTSTNRRRSRDELRVALTPAHLLDGDGDKTLDYAVRTLQDLAVIAVDGNDIALQDDGLIRSHHDYSGFTDLVRSRVLEAHRNQGIAEPGDQGPKDLVRALACFLTLDAYGAYGEDALEALLRNALPPHIGEPNFNDVRRNRFGYWSRALGFAAGPLLQTPSKLTLQPDCTAAVRRTAHTLWPRGTRLGAREVITGLLDALPVLPGGQYSLALGLKAPAQDVSSALSFALFCGEEQGWLKFDSRSDADDEVLLVDPDRADGTQRITHLIIQEPLDG